MANPIKWLSQWAFSHGFGFCGTENWAILFIWSLKKAVKLHFGYVNGSNLLPQFFFTRSFLDLLRKHWKYVKIVIPLIKMLPRGGPSTNHYGRKVAPKVQATHI